MQYVSDMDPKLRKCACFIIAACPEVCYCSYEIAFSFPPINISQKEVSFHY